MKSFLPSFMASCPTYSTHSLLVVMSKRVQVLEHFREHFMYIKLITCLLNSNHYYHCPYKNFIVQILNQFNEKHRSQQVGVQLQRRTATRPEFKYHFCFYLVLICLQCLWSILHLESVLNSGSISTTFCTVGYDG